ncbi:M23 family peptidase, partial [Microcoleus sp. HI-ES]|nr:M23 family peptidase [Microcoleus sp. HI-ES]
MLLLALSIGIVLISPYLQQQVVKAQSGLPSRVATGNLWQEASFPVENFETYTSPFGPRGGDFHYGLDLAAPEGSYIRNWWGGQIVEVWEDGRCGTGMV